MRPFAIAPALRNRLAFWALAGLALFAAHDAIFLAQLGPGRQLTEALRTAGHGYWTVASLVLVTVALLAAIATGLRVRGLRRRAAAVGAIPSVRAYRQRLIRAWWRLAVVVALGFVIQENVEHLVVHGHLPGLGVLVGPEYPLALPIIGLVTGAAAILAALVMRTQAALIEAIEAALRGTPRRAPRLVPHPSVRLAAAAGSILATPGAGRAPPTLVVVIH